MKGIGTVIHMLAIVEVGGGGMFLSVKIPDRIKRLIAQFVGLAALFLGARSLIDAWFSTDTPGVEVTGTILVILALVIGGAVGYALRFDRLTDKLGGRLGRLDPLPRIFPSLKKQSRPTGKPPKAGRASGKHAAPAASAEERDHRFTDGFVASSLLCAFSAMTLSGVINEGIEGEIKGLLIVAAIDAVLVFGLALAYGSGAVFGALTVLAAGELLTFISAQWSEKMTDTLVSHLTLVGAAVTIGVGICLCFEKRWRVVNLLPAFLIPPLYGLIVQAVEHLSDK